MKATDQYFDGIADKFVRNIYGTTKGKLRHLLLLDALAPYLSGPPQSVIEIGGGTGIMTKALADQGHNVTLTDASTEILALAREFLSDTSGIDIKHSRLQELSTLHHYDLVVCHAVLEWLADPFEALSILAEKIPSGGRLSLSFFNRDAALFTNAVYGNFDYIARGMKVKKQVRLNPTNSLRPAEVIEFTERHGFRILSKTGIRCFHDYMHNKPDTEEVFAQLLTLERQYCDVEPFCWLGKYFHLMLEKC
ncbi:methyltransferase domain-containing protein [Salinimonas chungwhensis]|uniref:methyltransferase domain-containing protein n=1 Tax=Salinimonas chungwhensis TaxID=265425 RepID=UPI0003674C96|nr:methyltransferase domain-containing protein [Salinimonas chungwhensis]